MTDKTMTLEQALELGYRAGFISACNWPEPCSQDVDSPSFAIELRVFIEKHMPLARQSEGVSDEDVQRAVDAFDGAWHSDACTEDMMRAALTAVLRNRPAQEKAEPVAEVVAAESDDGYLIPKHARLLHEAARKLPVGTKLYKEPPAERVRVPGCLSADDLAVLRRLRNALPEVGLNGWHRGVTVLCKILSAAPEADHHD